MTSAFGVDAWRFDERCFENRCRIIILRCRRAFRPRFKDNASQFSSHEVLGAHVNFVAIHRLVYRIRKIEIWLLGRNCLYHMTRLFLGRPVLRNSKFDIANMCHPCNSKALQSCVANVVQNLFIQCFCHVCHPDVSPEPEVGS
ncbi:hypothetical protein SAMN02927914_00128 [Mesorhizobium qingshengii]|uniref:Uncharacterized protein n=1 Tax=Mesorhizobium qingshengii TaxID=1165689 RepID=A0A1G5V047_9HYPH|nr:hypothetical protein SAMN02927914_00128 [Mesorhizobium qingshengii]